MMTMVADEVITNAADEYINELRVKNKTFNLKGEAMKQADEWLTWCISNQHVSISSNDIPKGILPEDWFGVLLDCKVFCKEGPDDALFNENADIRRMVARGNCFLKLRSPEWVVETTHVLRGLPKFCEGLGEVEGQSGEGGEDKWKDYFTKDITETSYILSSNKLNGESGHMAALLIHGTPYWLGGSKNVSMLFRNRDDIKKYANIQRYSIAMEICEEWMNYVEDHHQEADRLHSFMCEHKLTGNFEFLSPHHQHIEDFSHMTKPQLIFITWTFLNLQSVLEKPLNSDQPTSSSSSSSQPASSSLSSPTSPSSSSSFSLSLLLCVPPDISICVAQRYKLQTIEIERAKMEELYGHVRKVRHQSKVEGCVMYFVDNHHNVIGIIKKKTVWYIIIRALREKLRSVLSRLAKNDKRKLNGGSIKCEHNNNNNNSNDYGDHLVNKEINSGVYMWHKRLGELKKWLNLSDVIVEQWKDLGEKFFKWVVALVVKEGIGNDDVMKLYPVHWISFLRENGLTDEMDFNATS